MSEKTIENYIDKMIIWENLKQLKEEERQIIILYCWWGYKDAEIGKMFNLSQQTINYRRKIAYKKLKNKIYQSSV